MSNATVDPMHDINEGCAMKFLSKLLKYCSKNKVLSSDKLENLIKFFDDYGSVDVPSAFDFEKKNLGQNAAQAMSLFRQIPFILFKWRYDSKLTELWKCYQALLYICDVSYSYEVTENELQELENQVALHLDLYIKFFGDLIPKQHFLVHYASRIRAIGPLIFCNMMRFDSKHRVLKVIRNQTNNFKAINKTLAYQHQKQMSLVDFSYQDDVHHGVLRTFENDLLTNFIHTKLNHSESVHETQFLKLNHYKYVPKTVVVYEKHFHEIRHIVYVHQKFYFICT